MARAPARQNGYRRGWQGSGQTEEWALEEKRCTGDALLLPVWVKCPHQEGLSVVQKPCRFKQSFFSFSKRYLISLLAIVELAVLFPFPCTKTIKLLYIDVIKKMERSRHLFPLILNCHLAGNVKMENFSSPSSAHLRNLREKERQVQSQFSDGRWKICV